MYRIYTKETISKEVFNVNLNEEELNLVMEGNVFKDHPELNPDDYIVIEKEHDFENPTYHSSTNTIEEMTKFEKYNNGLYELQYNEVVHDGDILMLQVGQYIDEEGVLQTVPKIDGTRVEWNWETHIWEEKASDFEIAEAQYREYETMDTPSTLEEMKRIDPELANELIEMLITLRGIMYSLQSQTYSADFKLTLPKPSEELVEFKNHFKKFKF